MFVNKIFYIFSNNLSDKLTQLSEDITQIQNNLHDKANIQEFKELQGQFNESAQNHSKELRELRENIMHSQTELNDQLSKKVDAQEVNKYLKRIRIAYIVTTALLTVGLIVSFII